MNWELERRDMPTCYFDYMERWNPSRAPTWYRLISWWGSRNAPLTLGL